MAERDRFELDLAAALRAYLEEAPTEVRPAELARQFAVAYPHRRPALGRWSFGLAPALLWLLLLAGLLMALVGGALIAGSGLRRFLPAVVPPIGQVYACPPGSTPDEPGPVIQATPPFFAGERVALDRRAGRLVAVTLGADGLAPETWTLDLCSNTWTQMHPDRELPDFVAGQLVYDAHADATIGIVNGPDGALPGRVWAYDLEANSWIQKGPAPSGVALGAYDPVSGLVVAAIANTLAGAIDLWTYDVEADAWTQVRQANGPPCGYMASAYDASVDRWVTWRERGWGAEKAMCLIDLRAGTWSGTRTVTPPDLGTGFYLSVSAVVYDETTQRTVFSGPRWVAYDATADRWETLVEGDPGPGVPLPIVYDPLHRRLVGVGWFQRPDVAFDPVTRVWTVLVERPGGAPWSPPAPVPTGLEPVFSRPEATQAETLAPTSAPTSAPSAPQTAAP
jgi:hypothetical protein